jgi:hypothetical protein
MRTACALAEMLRHARGSAESLHQRLSHKLRRIFEAVSLVGMIDPTQQLSQQP